MHLIGAPEPLAAAMAMVTLLDSVLSFKESWVQTLYVSEFRITNLIQYPGITGIYYSVIWESQITAVGAYGSCHPAFLGADRTRKMVNRLSNPQWCYKVTFAHVCNKNNKLVLGILTTEMGQLEIRPWRQMNYQETPRRADCLVCAGSKWILSSPHWIGSIQQDIGTLSSVTIAG